MYKVNELFGIYTNGKSMPDLHEALKLQVCPWASTKGGKCYKTRKSDSSIAIGTCSLHFDNIRQPLLICPSRLKDRNKIFNDCIQFVANNIAGNELNLIPEVSTSVGNIDFMLVVAHQKKVVDFVALELQTIDTTGSVWNFRQDLLRENGYDVEPGGSKRSVGINWKMTAKTILAQMVQKAELFDGMSKNLVLICQTPLYEYMEKSFNFAQVHERPSDRDVLHFHVYDYNPLGTRMELSLAFMRSASLDVVQNMMGMNADASKEYSAIIEALTPKIIPDYRFTPFSESR